MTRRATGLEQCGGGAGGGRSLSGSSEQITHSLESMDVAFPRK